MKLKEFVPTTRVTARFAFRNEEDKGEDPNVVTFRWLQPDDTVVTHVMGVSGAINKVLGLVDENGDPLDGVFEESVVVVAEGRWAVGGYGTEGGPVGGKEIEFDVRSIVT